MVKGNVGLDQLPLRHASFYTNTPGAWGFRLELDMGYFFK